MAPTRTIGSSYTASLTQPSRNWKKPVAHRSNIVVTLSDFKRCPHCDTFVRITKQKALRAHGPNNDCPGRGMLVERL
jgi:hypothetical protein